MKKIFTVLLFGALFLLVGSFGLFYESLNLRLGGAILMGILIIALVSAPTHWALFFLSMYVCLEGVGKMLTNYHPVVHIGSDLLIMAFVGKALVQAAYGAVRLPERFPPFFGLLALHYVWFLIAFFNPSSRGLIPSIAGAKVYVTITSLFFFGYYTTKSAKDVRFFFKAWLIAGLLQCITALYQASIGPESVTGIHPGYAQALLKYEGYGFRPFGLTNQPGMPSVYVPLIMGLVLYFLVTAKKKIQGILMMLAVPVLVFTTIVCQVRTQVGKTLAAFTVFLLLDSMVKRVGRARFPFGGVATVFLVLVLAVAIRPILDKAFSEVFPAGAQAVERISTLFSEEHVKAARPDVYPRFERYIESYPFGAGLAKTGPAAGKFRDFQSTEINMFFTDNLLLTLIIDLGIPGLLILTSIYMGIFLKILKNVFTLMDPALRRLSLAIWVGMGASFISWYSSEGFLYNPEASFFWLFAGIALKIPDFDREVEIPIQEVLSPELQAILAREMANESNTVPEIEPGVPLEEA